MFRPLLEKAVRRSGTWKGSRPGFDAALKFRMLVLQALHGLSLQQTDYLVQDRLSWMRFPPSGNTCAWGLRRFTSWAFESTSVNLYATSIYLIRALDIRCHYDQNRDPVPAGL